MTMVLAHNATSICQLLAKKNVIIFHHQPHTLPPPNICQIWPWRNIFFFLKLKLKGHWFGDIHIILKNVTEELKATTEEEYKPVLESLAQSVLNTVLIYTYGILYRIISNEQFFILFSSCSDTNPET